MNSSHVNLHKYYSYGQDMHNFRQNDMSNFLGVIGQNFTFMSFYID